MNTEMLKAERNQRLSHTTIEKAVDGILWLDARGKVHRANEAARRMLGYSLEELLTMSVPEFDPDYPYDVYDEFWRHLRTGRHLTFESRHQRKDGSIYPVEITVSYFDFEGEEYGCTFIRDITERKRVETELRKALEEVHGLRKQLEAENTYLQEEIKLTHNFREMVGTGLAFKEVLALVEQVAVTDANVLIQGETGTGKELIARAVQSLSRRKDRPLVKVNCATLPPNLLESEVFGHEKGAFTGALFRKIGRFELANGGTIFLDEIGDLPLECQSKLLRVLQEGEFERLGGTDTIKVNVRVIAATNRNLSKQVALGNFREDLYYRLNVFPINCPPLRERAEDIPFLVRYFVQKFSAKAGKSIEAIPQRVMSALQNYHWPGNIRELENIIERAVIISRGPKLELGDWFVKGETPATESAIPTLESLEKRHILEVLEKTSWRVSGAQGAARILGLKPTTLEARMKKLGIARHSAIA
jgi:formate hydrogenlyase transcriptional activator